jgi:hypothetical protein
MLKVIQHNCRQSGEVLQALLETGVRWRVDIMLIQEPPMDAHYRHPGYGFIRTCGGVMMARRIDSEWTCSTEDRLAAGAEGDVQVLSIGKKGYVGQEIRLVNIYDQRGSITDGFCPARQAR